MMLALFSQVLGVVYALLVIDIWGRYSFLYPLKNWLKWILICLVTLTFVLLQILLVKVFG